MLGVSIYIIFPLKFQKRYKNFSLAICIEVKILSSCTILQIIQLMFSHLMNLENQLKIHKRITTGGVAQDDLALVLSFSSNRTS